MVMVNRKKQYDIFHSRFNVYKKPNNVYAKKLILSAIENGHRGSLQDVKDPKLTKSVIV